MKTETIEVHKSPAVFLKWDVFVKLNDEDETVQVSVLFDAHKVRGIFTIVVSKPAEKSPLSALLKIWI